MAKRTAYIRGGVSLAALLAATPVFAQAAAPQDTAVAEEDAGDAPIVVTGTRVIRDGFNAPTPQTVLGEDALEARAPANLANAVNDLPQLAPTVSPGTTLVGVGGGTGGANILNLRGLGINRTLVLLNGNRVVPSTTTGGVDVNLLPQGLVSRVDVVTGGASAAWGSDAVAGVVNFVLNTKYEGLKGNFSAGSAFEGDAESYNANLTFGTSFADGRGHILLDAGYARQGGIERYTDRDWYQGWKIVNNPAYAAGSGRPQQLVSTADFLFATPGSIILSGARAFTTAFDANGQPFTFNPGTPSAPYKIGGTPNDIARDYVLVVPVEYGSGFGRLSYDIFDDVTAYVEGSYSRSKTSNTSAAYLSLASILILPDNAFLPASLAGSGPFAIGKAWENLGLPRPRNERSVTRIVAGLEGKLGGSWSWKAYYQYGESDVLNQVTNNPIVANINRAVDAVRNGAGQIVCRSAAANPSCVPLNPFGTQAATAAQLAYVNGTATQNIELKQEVAAFTINGEPFSTWAGPVSFAAGIEGRNESYSADADPLSIASAYWLGNYKPGAGRYGVKEAFAEVVVPLARDVPLLKSLDLNLAGRVTDYSTSGTVGTWKAGLSWDVIDDIRLRATHSRDIRAPNLNDLFLGGQVNTQVFTDPANGNASVTTVQVIQGNPDLEPEIADTNTIGVILTPSFLPGLSASVDYYRTKINGAVTSLGGQQIINNCAAGQTGYCSAIIRAGGTATGTITRVNVFPFNANSEKISGIDYELAYTTPLSWLEDSGRLSLRVLASNTRERETVALGGTTNQLGMLASGHPPKWRWYNTLSYASDFMRTQIAMRHTSAGVLDNRYVECTTSCPNATAAAPTIDNNRIAAATYFDLSQTFKIRFGGHEAELYGVIENLFDKDPPVAAIASFLFPGATGNYHDTIGRRFRVGVRFDY
jgi:iron complex outermembrane receptor protein